MAKFAQPPTSRQHFNAAKANTTLARDLDDDGDLDMVGTRGNSFPFDGVIWLEQVRTTGAEAVFKQARKIDSEQMGLPSNP